MHGHRMTLIINHQSGVHACRELQRKYASGSSDAVSAKKQPRSGSSLFGRDREGLRSETPEAVGKPIPYSFLILHACQEISQRGLWQ